MLLASSSKGAKLTTTPDWSMCKKKRKKRNQQRKNH